MSIAENIYNTYPYGMLRYFKGDRLFNEKSIYEFNKEKIKARELVTFDCALMDLEEITKDEINAAKGTSEQILAVIVRPGIAPNCMLERDNEFEFCGYDLVEFMSCISAITNCGADWGSALKYSLLNQYGLFSNYRQAVEAQLALAEQFPDESHAYCEIVEIWRLLSSNSER